MLDFDFSGAGLLLHALEGFIGLIVGVIVDSVGGFMNGLLEAATYLPTYF